MAELFFNDPGTTLAALCNVGDTTITVSTYSGYPATGNFRIKIDSEIMLVTSVSTVTWTVTRAMESTTATSHSNGAAVNHVFSGGSITQGLSEAGRVTTSIGTFANIPASPKLGDRYKCTDSGYEAIYDGSSWRFFFNGSPEVFPPQRTNTFNTWVNQGSSSVTTTNGNLIFTATGTGSDQVRMYGKAAPSFPYTIEACMLMQAAWNSHATAPGGLFTGIGLYNGTQLMIYDITHQISTANSVLSMEWLYFNSVTSFGSGTRQVNYPSCPSMIWLKLLVTNSTARTLSFSLDGQTWTAFFTESSGTSFTPTYIGPSFCVWNPGLSGITINSDMFVSWKQY